MSLSPSSWLLHRKKHGLWVLALSISPGVCLLLWLPWGEIQKESLSMVKAILTVARKAQETLHKDTDTALGPLAAGACLHQHLGLRRVKVLPGSQSKGTGVWRHFYCPPQPPLRTAHFLWNKLILQFNPKVRWNLRGRQIHPLSCVRVLVI